MHNTYTNYTGVEMFSQYQMKQHLYGKVVEVKSSIFFCYRTSNFKLTMFQTKTQYDRGVNTFSPEGRLFQVEYAIEAIKLGTTAIGIKTNFGVVLAVEKRITSTLMESSSVEKLMEIDRNIGCAMSGLTADA